MTEANNRKNPVCIIISIIFCTCGGTLTPRCGKNQTGREPIYQRRSIATRFAEFYLWTKTVARGGTISLHSPSVLFSKRLEVSWRRLFPRPPPPCATSALACVWVVCKKTLWLEKERLLTTLARSNADGAIVPVMVIAYSP